METCGRLSGAESMEPRAESQSLSNACGQKRERSRIAPLPQNNDWNRPPNMVRSMCSLLRAGAIFIARFRLTVVLSRMERF
jgi:hypothetical protein